MIEEEERLEALANATEDGGEGGSTVADVVKAAAEVCVGAACDGLPADEQGMGDEF